MTQACLRRSAPLGGGRLETHEQRTRVGAFGVDVGVTLDRAVTPQGRHGIPTLELFERHERLAEQVAQLVLARQPHDLVLLDAVEGPLGRAVEADDVAGREVVHVDGDLTDDEDVVLHAAHGHDETVPGDGLPAQSRVGEPAGELDGQHVLHGHIPPAPSPSNPGSGSMTEGTEPGAQAPRTAR